MNRFLIVALALSACATPQPAPLSVAPASEWETALVEGLDCKPELKPKCQCMARTMHRDMGDERFAELVSAIIDARGPADSNSPLVQDFMRESEGARQACGVRP